MLWLKSLFRIFLGDRSGATAIEYALIASLISIAIVASLLAVNDSMSEIYGTIRNYIVPALEGTAAPAEG